MTNLNDKITIQLTPEGVEFYKNYRDRMGIKGFYPGLKEDMLTTELWKFAQVFGHKLYMGKTNTLHSMYFEFI